MEYDYVTWKQIIENKKKNEYFNKFAVEETNGNRESGSKARQYAKNISVLYLYNDVYNVKKIPKHLGCAKLCVIHNPGF